ncbi:hypothetical protein [Cypionkella psychrotolerans]|uniref:hypothetical protein n=1 Tax=Cypionkella psychrotolerans TaxID=1678131 RepID=UPI0012E1761F|nr:hypothetical protein [Cypionkella psychrotolerans]
MPEAEVISYGDQNRAISAALLGLKVEIFLRLFLSLLSTAFQFYLATPGWSFISGFITAAILCIFFVFIKKRNKIAMMLFLLWAGDTLLDAISSNMIGIFSLFMYAITIIEIAVSIALIKWLSKAKEQIVS